MRHISKATSALLALLIPTAALAGSTVTITRSVTDIGVDPTGLCYSATAILIDSGFSDCETVTGQAAPVPVNGMARVRSFSCFLAGLGYLADEDNMDVCVAYATEASPTPTCISGSTITLDSSPMTALAAQVNPAQDTISWGTPSAGQRWIVRDGYGPVRLTTTGSLPGGLLPATDYYIKRCSAAGANCTFSSGFSLTRYGARIDITSQGSGTHTATPTSEYFPFNSSTYPTQFVNLSSGGVLTIHVPSFTDGGAALDSIFSGACKAVVEVEP